MVKIQKTMPRLKVANFTPMWGSHMPVLIKVLEISEGPVLELGIGPFSTPLLHTMCEIRNRPLVSYENDPNYMNSHRAFPSDNHKMFFVENWDDAKIDDVQWGMAFVDHGPDYRRNTEIGRLKDNSQFVVVHDTEPNNNPLYKYEEIIPLFKYRLHYDRLFPHTDVFSNFIDVTDLKI